MTTPQKPRRIQRRRTRGWTAVDASSNPNGYVFVGRGSGYGNSWKVGSTGWTVLPGGWIDKRPHEPLTREQAIASFINSRTYDIEFLRQIRADLAGKDLMCWCGLDRACHGDWLLEVANSPRPIEEFVDHSPKPDFLAAA